MEYVRRRPKDLVVDERRIYHAEVELCPSCGSRLHLSGYYASQKTVQHLGGVVHIAHHRKECRTVGCALFGKRYSSAFYQHEALPHSSYGLDVVAQVGYWRDREHLSGEEIHRRLQGSIQLSLGQVYGLQAQYRMLLACSERSRGPALSPVAQTYGGVILSLDGLEPEGASEQLWVVREVLSGGILAAGWLPRVTQETLTQFLAPVQTFLREQGLSVRATISDKQKPLVAALESLFPGVPHQFCQAHYLRNIANPVYAQDHALKTSLRHEVRTALRDSLRQVAGDSSDGAFSPSAGDRAVCRGEPGEA